MCALDFATGDSTGQLWFLSYSGVEGGQKQKGFDPYVHKLVSILLGATVV